MSHHDLPDEALDPPPPAPLYYVEQALLGALLLRPEQLSALAELRPDHFGAPAHDALFTALRTLPLPEPELHRKEPVWVQAVLAAAATSAPGLNSTYLHSLVAACPRPEHAAAYGQIVRAEHLRRSLREQAVRLEQLSTDRALPDPVDAVLAHADAMTAFLDQGEPAWPRQPGPAPKAPVPADPPPLACDDAQSDEQLLLATITAHPDDLAQVSWLPPNAFVSALHRGLYECLISMARRSIPIDPLTVVWHSQHHAPVGATDPAEILAFLRQPVGSVEHWAERIHRRAVLSSAGTAARSIVAATHDPAHSPHHLILTARRALAQLTRARHRGPPSPHRGIPNATPPALPALSTARPIRTSR